MVFRFTNMDTPKTEAEIEAERAYSHAWDATLGLLLNGKPIISVNNNEHDEEVEESKLRRIQKSASGTSQISQE